MDCYHLLSIPRRTLAAMSLTLLLTAGLGSAISQTTPAKKATPTPPKTSVKTPPVPQAKAGGTAGAGSGVKTAGGSAGSASGVKTAGGSGAGAGTKAAGGAGGITTAGGGSGGASGMKTTGGPGGGGKGGGVPGGGGGTKAAGGAGGSIGGVRTPGGPGERTGRLAANDHGGARAVGYHETPGRRPGEFVGRDAHGNVRDVHARGMDIHHNLAGGRRVEMERADHSRLYYERGRPGYISHPYMYGGHEYARRTYYYNGRAYDRFYNHYEYRPGVSFEVYSPAHYYAPGFYGWAYNPWVTPVQYQWGFATAAWYGYYPGYFTPYPVYASSQLWLTDYLISQTLQASYAAAQAANAQAQMAGMAPLTPETKQLIANEVALQIKVENQAAQNSAQQADAASGSIGPMLSDGQPHVFVAGKEVDVVDASTNQECAVTDGDVLRLLPPVDPNGTTANLMVMSSKGGVECHNRATVTVALTDLQDMQNHLRETVDLGLQELQSKQGTGGLPRAPVSALAPPAPTLMAQNAPSPDKEGEKDLAAQAQQADQSEKEATADTSAGAAGGPSDAPAAMRPVASVAPVEDNLMGKTLEQAVAAEGQFTKKIPLGPNGDKYVFKDVTVTIKGGKVVDIQ